ncbi:MAG: NADH-quinone oxidoreductase subunit NuoH [Candidatus Heimdallarchaeota archaeon]
MAKITIMEDFVQLILDAYDNLFNDGNEWFGGGKLLELQFGIFPENLKYLTTFIAQLMLLFMFVAVDIIMIIWLERKVMAHGMHRRGPMIDPLWPIIGRIGLMQNIADFIKFFSKEDVVPEDADRRLFDYSIFIIIVTAIVGVAIIPFTQDWFITSPAAGFLYIVAVFSLFPIAVLVGGWASNNKYSIIGGFRSAAQLISYEIPLVLAIAGVVMWSGTLSLLGIVEAQQNGWFAFVMPVGVLVFLVSMLAEAERIPFDLPEAEAELVMGWRTEFAAWRYMMSMFHEYAAFLISSFLVVIFFFGGWDDPFLGPVLVDMFGTPIQAVLFLVKVHIIIFIMIWVRAALPRVRIDQLLDIGWKRMIPLGLLNLFWVALLLYFDPVIFGWHIVS